MKAQKKQSTKYVAMLTYIVSLICVILCFVLPVFGSYNYILASTFPDILNKTFGIQWSAGNPFGLIYNMTIFGKIPSSDGYAWFTLILAIIGVIGVFGLVPVLASKKTSKFTSAFSYTFGCFASVVLLAINFMSFAQKVVYLNYVIALAGILLAMAVQCLVYKKSSGFMKVFTGILSLIIFLFFFDLKAIIGTGLWDSIGTALGASPSFYGDQFGMIALLNAIIGNDALVFTNISTNATACTIASVAILVAGIMVTVNLILDMICLGSKATKASKVFSLLRYLVAFLAILVTFLVILITFKGTIACGYLLYAALILSGVQFIISVIRVAVKKKVPDTVEIEDPVIITANELMPANTMETADEEPAVIDMAEVVVPPVEEPVVETTVAEEETAPMVAEEFKEETVIATPVVIPETEEVTPAVAPTPAPTTYVYTVNSIYQGPSDEFIRKLTNDEKIEFSRVFLEKIHGNFTNVPDYVIGGNNKKFFSSVFIYLGKFRALLSDGLMNKIYMELNLLS